jgi:hypothetical protein
MNIITINGRQYSVEGRKIIIRDVKNAGAEVRVNNQVVESNIRERELQITFTGDLADLDCTSAIIYGNVKGDIDCTSITCGDVGGDVDATNVHCKKVNGKIDAVNVSIKN